MPRRPDLPPARRSSTTPLEYPAALFVGNALWLDFVNTRYVNRNRPVDVLVSFESLVGWLVEAGSLGACDSRTAIARWNGTLDGTGALEEALAFRDSLRNLAELLASWTGGRAREEMPDGGGSVVPPAMATAVAAINRIFRENVSYDEVAPVPDHGGTVLRFARHARLMDFTPHRLLAPVADSASELLCGGGDLSRIHRCGNPKCVLYFYDTTKNRSRLFCSSTGCGNRVKAAAQYRRSRSRRAKSVD